MTIQKQSALLESSCWRSEGFLDELMALWHLSF